MNPYEAPSRLGTKSRRLPSIRYFVIAASVASIGLATAAPGLAYLTSDMTRRSISGRQYATYDPELNVFGISITPGTAQMLAFGVAPVLMAVSAFLVFRGLQNRRRSQASGAAR